MSDDASWKKKADDDGLGSLAQSARKSSLKQARVLLALAAVLTLLEGGVGYAASESLARKAIEAEKKKAGPMVVFDPVAIKNAEDEVRRVIELVSLGVLAVGVVFVVLAIVVHLAPVACTVTGLVLYIGLHAVFAVANPVTLVQGILWKVIIIVGLSKAIQAAAAYQRELKAERRAARDHDRDSDEEYERARDSDY